MPSYTNALQISQEGKGIPYGGTGEIREDGDANYGFKNLKGRPDRLADIPELARDEALHDLVASLNAPESAFGSVGCVSALVDESEGHRVSGYVEFAFDSAEKVADAGSYFPVFFHFDRALHVMKFDDKIHYHWELMGATFHHTDTTGFTVSVTVNTGWYPTGPPYIIWTQIHGSHFASSGLPSDGIRSLASIVLADPDR
ncbi:hypothetical protein [Sphingobium yanoikuyae]|uniref:hypothetical protein n=1 Tax=Sphingobium yanoikuyae TaxID=13690 RepID=UPI000F7EB919